MKERTARSALGKATSALVLAVAVGGSALAIVGVGPACGTTACTPDEHDLGEAPSLTLRALPGRTTYDGPCATSRTMVISSEAELRAYYESLGVVAQADGAPPPLPAIEYPTVDFSQERVVVSESSMGEGMVWAVRQQDSVVVGLLGCGASAAAPTTCVIQLAAVPALVTKAESRKCGAVGCGQPQAAPTRAR